mgnify:CR=1 FL=1
MAVAQPQFLLVFNESTGKTVTNHGSHATPYTIRADAACTQGSDFNWTPDSGPYPGTGKLSTVFPGNGSGTNLTTWLSTAHTPPASAYQNINVACGFRVISPGYDAGQGYGYLFGPSLSGLNGDCIGSIIAPTVGGDFNFRFRFRSISGYMYESPLITGLSFNTDYVMSACLNAGTHRALFKWDSTTATDNAYTHGGMEPYNGSWPYINRTADQDNYHSVKADFHFFVYGRNQTAWSTTNLDEINADPATAIGGWPASGGGSGPALAGALLAPRPRVLLRL